ncbi:MAG: UxaA family hydrolase [Casimicrobiaceae bacterium]
MQARSADALVLHADDNVATALRALAAGALVRVLGGGTDRQVRLRQAIPLCHKFALVDLAAGGVVRKYGEAIGTAREAVVAGAHVHVHNLASQRARKAG